MSFKIITDSTANLSNEYLQKNSISVVTLYYLLDGEVFPAYKTDKPELLEEFYQRIKNKPKLSTSCANDDQYYVEFEKAVKSGVPVLYIGFSSGVSATFSSAMIAKDRILQNYPNAEIYCVDTLTGSFGQGYFVEQSVIMRENGKTAKEVYDYITSERERMNTYVTVDDLYYLHKGGRIPALAYRIGTLVKIKPIIKVNGEGKLVSTAKVISRKQSFTHLANVIKENIDNSCEKSVFIAHAGCRSDAMLLAEKIKQIAGVDDIKIGLLEAVIGSHTGIGGIAVFFLGKK